MTVPKPNGWPAAQNAILDSSTFQYEHMNTTKETKPLDLDSLKNAVTENAAAFRCRRRLQPAGGAGDKVFPPTFAGAVYAVEQRRVPERPDPVTCVVLDTVQAQANRMEQALQEALDGERLKIPVLKVDFSKWSPTGSEEEAKRFVDDSRMPFCATARLRRKWAGRR
jgi:hypothetical protein